MLFRSFFGSAKKSGHLGDLACWDGLIGLSPHRIEMPRAAKKIHSKAVKSDVFKSSILPFFGSAKKSGHLGDLTFWDGLIGLSPRRIEMPKAAKKIHSKTVKTAVFKSSILPFFGSAKKSGHLADLTFWDALIVLSPRLIATPKAHQKSRAQ